MQGNRGDSRARFLVDRKCVTVPIFSYHSASKTLNIERPMLQGLIGSGMLLGTSWKEIIGRFENVKTTKNDYRPVLRRSTPHWTETRPIEARNYSYCRGKQVRFMK